MNQLQQKKESVLKCLMYVVLIIKFKTCTGKDGEKHVYIHICSFNRVSKGGKDINK